MPCSMLLRYCTTILGPKQGMLSVSKSISAWTPACLPKYTDMGVFYIELYVLQSCKLLSGPEKGSVPIVATWILQIGSSRWAFKTASKGP